MSFLLLAIFRDYKQYWFKIMCTIFGVIISLSLFIVIELFTYLFQVPSTESRLTVPYSHQLVHNHGKINQHDIEKLSRYNELRQFSPASDVHDMLDDGHGHVFRSRVRGIDRFQLTRRLSQLLLSSTEQPNIEFDPFDLNQAFLVASFCDNGKKQMVSTQRSAQKIQVMCIKINIVEPLVLMDIALFHAIYSKHNAVDSLLFDVSDSEARAMAVLLNEKFPMVSLVSLKEEQGKYGKWVNSLTYNLKFLAFISLIVSTCLMIQFFRFLAKQRAPMFDQLFQLGINETVIKRLFILEVGIIAIVTNGSALLLGALIAKNSLDVFNQMVSMFYFNVTGEDILFHWSIVLKAVIASLGSFSVAYVSYFYGKGIGHQPFRMIQIGLGGSVLVMIGLCIMLQYPLPWVVIGSSLLIIGGFLGVCVGSMSMIGHALRRIKHPRLVPFKMCRDTLLNDPLSYGAIVFVISLSAGLIISMSVFVSSFSTTVKSWLDTVTFHDIYIQHQANSIQVPVALPNSVLEVLSDLGHNGKKNSTLFRVPFIYQGLPTQIVFRSNIHDPDYSRFIFKERLNGPFSNADVIVTEPFAMKHQLKVGDKLFLNGILASNVRIVGISYDFVSEFGQIIADNQLPHLQTEQLHGIAINASSDEQVTSILSKLSQINGVNVTTRQGIIDASMAIFNDTFTFTWFVVLLTAGIAIFSLVNLLTIVCINRKRELIQLWHIGCNTRHLTMIVLAQITIIGIVSSAISLIIGGCFYSLIVYGIQRPTFNWSIFLHIPWPLVLLVPIVTFALCLIIGGLFMLIVGKQLGKGRLNESIRNHT